MRKKALLGDFRSADNVIGPYIKACYDSDYNKIETLT
jgi:hypothetical protein